MTYQPIIPGGGNVGWSFLKATREDQQEAFENSGSVKQNADYFRDNIGKVSTAEDLVNDRRLLTVAVGAFGLDDDINNKFFIQKVLQEGTIDEDSFANRLADTRYFDLSEAFGFDLDPPKVVLSDLADKIVEQFEDRQFEIAIGNQDGDLRLALGISRDLDALAERELSEEGAWFTIMGNPPMRRVFELALGLPSQIAAIDIDQQLGEFKEKASSVFGTSNPADFVDPEIQEKLVRNFLFRSQLEANAANTTSGSVALSLLQAQQPLF